MGFITLMHAQTQMAYFVFTLELSYEFYILITFLFCFGVFLGCANITEFETLDGWIGGCEYYSLLSKLIVISLIAQQLPLCV